jgi:hypothetical protein
VWIAVVITNYLAWILGVGAGLAALGVNYQAARIIAGGCEAVYMYAAMRWVVFRDTRPRTEHDEPGTGPVHPDRKEAGVREPGGSPAP